ncbi:uncharacterized protein LOC131154851 [Malania oleifera]|uniref:uncharacterized protein LOC131154851 n=1 Tax=Malania oleifera TaxID=397392 RepID=UPI0025ADF03A|nr:uncharacterized protein LOC131154851 [Malania oleifera]
MDSLLASYGSSDEEGEEEQKQEELHSNSSKPPSKISGVSSNFSDSPKISSIFSSFPQPKSSVFSLPPPKSNVSRRQPSTNFPSSDPKNQEEEEGEGDEQQREDLSPASISTSNFRGQSSTDVSSGAKTSALFFSLPEPKSSSVFSAFPPPKSNIQALPILSTSEPYPKKVVQFKPPINPSFLKSRAVNDDDDDDNDDDDRDKERKRTKEFESSAQTSSVKSFLSSIPAPKNSAALGALPSMGSGRRSIVEADIPSSDSNSFRVESQVGVNFSVGNRDSHWIDVSSSAPSGVVSASSEIVTNGSDFSSGGSAVENYENHDSYGGFQGYGHYESNGPDDSLVTMEPDALGLAKNPVKVPGKRGRNEVPMEIVEVRQDELIKNRPREDQVKLTGIAFGPSYQPVSTKGKPSKLHKRKHQISSLYYDMKQKEMELAERRSKGFLTKAETQAKYGW